MIIFKHIRAGARVAPAFILFLYVLFLGLDLYTTWLATPDLKYEANWMVRILGFQWKGMITTVFVIMLFMITVFLISTEYIHLSFKNGLGQEKKSVFGVIFFNWKMVLSYIVIGCFYSHLIFSAFICINNYFGYEYLYSIRSFVSGISNYYIKNIMIGHPHYMLYCQLLIPIPGYILAIIIIARIRKKYRIQNLNK